MDTHHHNATMPTLRLRPSALHDAKKHSSDSIYRVQNSSSSKTNLISVQSSSPRPGRPQHFNVRDARGERPRIMNMNSDDTFALPRSATHGSVDELGSANGEPIVQDFAERYIPKEFQPDRQKSAGSPSMNDSSQLHPPPDDEGLASPDLSRRGIHIPSRTSSFTAPPKTGRRLSNSSATSPESREQGSFGDKSSYADSATSYETSASSFQQKDLPALQSRPIDEIDRLSPLAEDDPGSFDLVASSEDNWKAYSLEKRSEQLFSRDHLEEIFSEPVWMLRFTSFLSKHRPQSIPLLIYYLDSLKALKAIQYANAIAEALEPLHGHEFTQDSAKPTSNSVLEQKTTAAFDALVRDELPAWVTYTFIQYVSVSIQRRITGTLPPHLRDASEGLAEVFCLTDPSRPDNPIVFASEEFHRTTQYGVNYAIGRNCRFLQGPRTNPFSSTRIRKACEEQREISECFLNYRRDGSPFMNLLMIAPLFDSRGKLRYFIGAQVDISGLVKECTDLDALQRMLARQDAIAAGEEEEEKELKDEFQELSEMLNTTELEIVRRFGGRMHQEHVEERENSNLKHPRLLLKEPSPDLNKASFQLNMKQGGKLEGVYQNYLLVRPYPALRILFASPSLRIPGMLQSPFLSRVGGSARVRDELTAALAAGRGVTAKVRWISSPIGQRYRDANAQSQHMYQPDVEEGRPRWIHCTPLLGHNGSVGVWMVVIVDDDDGERQKKYRLAPPVAKDINGSRKAWNSGSTSFDSGGRESALGTRPHKPDLRSNTPTGPRPGTADTAETVIPNETKHSSNPNSGAFAEWERKMEKGQDGDGSMRSFAI